MRTDPLDAELTNKVHRRLSGEFARRRKPAAHIAMHKKSIAHFIVNCF